MKKRLVSSAIAVVVTAMLAYTAEQDTIPTLQLRGTINAIEQMQVIYDVIPASDCSMPKTEFALYISITSDSTEAN